MNLTETVIDGTLRDDGTLELDQVPNLAPGRVKVILKPAQTKTPATRGLAEVIDEIRQSREARGEQGRSAEDIEAGLREGVDQYDERMQALQSQPGTTPPAVR